MLPHLLSNFEIQKYYQNKTICNGVYSRNNLSKLKDGPYVINLDEYKSIGAHWTALYDNNNNVTYFDSFGAEDIPKGIKKFVGKKNIINIFTIQTPNSIMCRHFVLELLILCQKSKSLLDYTNLFYLNEYEKNAKIMSNIFNK